MSLFRSKVWVFTTTRETTCSITWRIELSSPIRTATLLFQQSLALASASRKMSSVKRHRRGIVGETRCGAMTMVRLPNGEGTDVPLVGQSASIRRAGEVMEDKRG